MAGRWATTLFARRWSGRLAAETLQRQAANVSTLTEAYASRLQRIPAPGSELYRPVSGRRPPSHPLPVPRIPRRRLTDGTRSAEAVAALREEHLSDVRKLEGVVQTAKSGLPSILRTQDPMMAQQLTAELYEADRLAREARAELDQALDATLSFERLTAVYETTDTLRRTCTFLSVVPPADTLPAGADRMPGKPSRTARGKRQQTLEMQEAAALERERLAVTQVDGGDAVPLSRSRTGGFAELYELGTDHKTLLRGFYTALLEMRRVAKVVKGGTTLHYRALVVVGNRAGVVGYGVGRAESTVGAIERATRRARRTVIHVPLFQQRTVPHEVRGKFCKCLVYVWPLKAGTGLRMNRVYHCVMEVLGVRDAGAKQHGARNKLNYVKALFDALTQLRDMQDEAVQKGMRVTDLASFIERKLSTEMHVKTPSRWTA